MELEPLKPPSDAQAAGAFARTVRRFRSLTAQQVADGIGIPLRTLARGPGHTRRPRRCRGVKM